MLGRKDYHTTVDKINRQVDQNSYTRILNFFFAHKWGSLSFGAGNTWIKMGMRTDSEKIILVQSYVLLI